MSRLNEILERVASLETSVSVIQKDTAESRKDMKEVLAWVNRGKGWTAAAMLFIGIVGAYLKEVVGSWFKGDRS